MNAHSKCINTDLPLFILMQYREAMSKPRESGGQEEIPNDLESLSEPSTSVAHLTSLEHFNDVCEWSVSS